jgi:hypothetical protein
MGTHVLSRALIVISFSHKPAGKAKVAIAIKAEIVETPRMSGIGGISGTSAATIRYKLNPSISQVLK